MSTNIIYLLKNVLWIGLLVYQQVPYQFQFQFYLQRRKETSWAIARVNGQQNL